MHHLSSLLDIFKIVDQMHMAWKVMSSFLLTLMDYALTCTCTLLTYKSDFIFFLVHFCTLYYHSVDVKADAASSVFKCSSVHGFLKVPHLSLVDIQSFPEVKEFVAVMILESSLTSSWDMCKGRRDNSKAVPLRSK